MQRQYLSFLMGNEDGLSTLLLSLDILGSFSLNCGVTLYLFCQIYQKLRFLIKITTLATTIAAEFRNGPVFIHF